MDLIDEQDKMADSRQRDSSAITVVTDERQRIFLEAFPFRYGRADFFRLLSAAAAPIGESFEKLLSGPFELTLPSTADFPFEHWYQENKNKERSYGYRPLGLGFPLLLLKEAGKIRLAPLFIWDLNMEPSSNPPGSWRLHRSKETPVGLNPLLRHWLQSNLPEETLRQLEKLPFSADGKEKDLPAQLRSMEAFSFGQSLPEHPELCESPALNEIDREAGGDRLFWSGIVAPFPMLHRTGNGNMLRQERRVAGGHDAGLCRMDPFQATAFQATRENRLTCIEGHAGSGKNQVLMQIVSNALSHGRKCLVVGATHGGLREVHRRLQAESFGRLGFLAIDPASDSPRLLEMLRSAAENNTVPKGYQPDRFQQVLYKWQRAKGKLDDSYQALRKPVFGRFNWADTVGHFLNSSRLEGKEMLTSQLQLQDFRFAFEEYEQMRRSLLMAQQLYRKVNTLRHPLQNLHPGIFTGKDKAAAKAFVLEQLEVTTRKLFQLQKKYIDRVNDYADQLSLFYENWYDRLYDPLQRLREKIADSITEYGKDFALTSMLSLRLYGSFLPRIREMRQEKEEIFGDYRKLVHLFQQSPQFDFEFAPAEEGRALPKMQESLEAFLQALDDWRESLPDFLQQELKRLSVKTVHPEINFQGHLSDLEEELDLRLADLNRVELYEQAFENRMLTIPRRRKYLEEVIEQLENTRLFMRDFDAFYEWYRFWLALSASEKKLIRALIKVKPDDWEAAFQSWYLHQCLTQAYDRSLPTASPYSSRQYVYNHDLLQSMLPDQIVHLWGQRRQEYLKSFRRNERRPYYQLFGRKMPEQLRERPLEALFGEYAEVITEVLPLWLTTPASARQLVAEEQPFDLVLVRESHLLTSGDLEPVLQKAKTVVLFGDETLEALGPNGSLMAEVRERVEEVHRLPYIHRWSPGDALSLRNPSFLERGAIQGFSVHFEQVDGSYDERTRCNAEEARQVIRLLNEVEKTPDNRYPAVMIATLTYEQRNLIAAYLREIKEQQLPGAETLEQLERNGLWVCHINEMAGEHPEVVLFSGTFGVVGLEGRLTDHINELNRQEGSAALTLLMSRPRKAIFVVNSVPRQEIDKKLQNPAAKGTFLFSNYLEYIYSLHKADAERQQQVIQRLIDYFPDRGFSIPSSPFIREMIISLQSYFDRERLHEDAMDAPLHLPLKVDPASVDASPAVIVPDGFFARTPATDYRWEFDRWEQYADKGYIVLPAWSVNWWKNAPLEAKALTAKIEKEMQDPST